MNKVRIFIDNKFHFNFQRRQLWCPTKSHDNLLKANAIALCLHFNNEFDCSEITLHIASFKRTLQSISKHENGLNECMFYLVDGSSSVKIEDASKRNLLFWTRTTPFLRKQTKNCFFVFILFFNFMFSFSNLHTEYHITRESNQSNIFLMGAIAVRSSHDHIPSLSNACLLLLLYSNSNTHTHGRMAHMRVTPLDLSLSVVKFKSPWRKNGDGFYEVIIKNMCLSGHCFTDALHQITIQSDTFTHVSCAYLNQREYHDQRERGREIEYRRGLALAYLSEETQIRFSLELCWLQARRLHP